ncbi:MAG: hypothetical protein MHMPM18_002311 [Marteilia pararefringens]
MNSLCDKFSLVSFTKPIGQNDQEIDEEDGLVSMLNSLHRRPELRRKKMDATLSGYVACSANGINCEDQQMQMKALRDTVGRINTIIELQDQECAVAHHEKLSQYDVDLNNKIRFCRIKVDRSKIEDPVEWSRITDVAQRVIMPMMNQ